MATENFKHNAILVISVSKLSSLPSVKMIRMVRDCSRAAINQLKNDFVG